MELVDRALEKVSVIDLKAFNIADKLYISAVHHFHRSEYAECSRYLRSTLKEQPMHQEALVLLASLYFKMSDLLPETEAEALAVNAMYYWPYVALCTKPVRRLKCWRSLKLSDRRTRRRWNCCCEHLTLPITSRSSRPALWT